MLQRARLKTEGRSIFFPSVANESEYTFNFYHSLVLFYEYKLLVVCPLCYVVDDKLILEKEDEALS